MKTKLLLLSAIFFCSSSLFSQSRSTESIGFNDITVIELGTHNDIWYGTDGHGFSTLDLNTGNMANYDLSNYGISQSSRVSAIVLDSLNGHRNAFVSTNNGVVYSIDQTNWQKLDPTNITDAVVGMFFGVAKDTLMIVQKDNGVLAYHIDSSASYQTKYTNPNLKNITCTLKGSIPCDTGFMVGTADTGVIWTKDYSTYNYIRTNPANQGMIDDRVNVILLDNNCGALFVGTKHGLSKCPLGTNPPPCYNLNTSNNSNFPSDDVTAIELGCDGKIWVGTRSSGIGVFEISTPPPAPSSISITRITGLPSDSITVIALDSACNILAGSADGNIAEISADTLKLIDTVKGTTSIRDITSESFSVKVYPQPSSNQINFVSEQTIKNGEFSLFDITGRTQQQISLGNTNHFATDVSSLQNGIYFYRIISDKQNVKTGKVQVLK